MAGHRPPVMRQDDAAVVGRPLKDVRIEGTGEAKISNEDHVEARSPSPESTHDPFVQVVIGEKPEHYALPLAADSRR